MSELQEKPRTMPAFANESEEADWWYSQRDALSERFLAKASLGALTSGRAARQFADVRSRRAASAGEAVKQAVELDPADALKASELAAHRGVEYGVFVRKLVHEALERELSATG